jgi:hypothetical protein
VTLSADNRLTAELARLRATTEQDRAVRAGEVARRHERLADHGPASQRALHAGMAATHRRLEQRHLTAAALHTSHAQLLDRWSASAARREPVPPAFISSVAGTLGSRGAAISLLGNGNTEALVVASDTTARTAQDLEFMLGEGPSRDASTDRLVVVADGATMVDRWPRYGPALARLGVRTVASAPLALRHLCLGALTVFDPRPSPPDGPASSLRTVADTLTHTVLLVPDGDGVTDIPDLPLFADADHRAVVHQAAGVVSVQNDCSVVDALALVRARAFAEGEPIDSVALRIVERRLRLN